MKRTRLYRINGLLVKTGVALKFFNSSGLPKKIWAEATTSGNEASQITARKKLHSLGIDVEIVAH